MSDIKITTAMTIQECAEESVKEAIKEHGEACDVVIVCVPIGTGNRVLRQFKEDIGFLPKY